MNAPWLTVITVVKDDADGLSRTVDSVRRQNLSDVEYVVIDSSVDRGSVPAILDRAGIASCIVWTEPAGIYPAMNVGLAKASGTYVYFANAGDEIADGALDDIRYVIDSHDPAWLFGAVEIVGRDGTRTVTPRWDYTREKATAFSRGHFPSHQGTVVKTALLREGGGFDTSYAIVADYAAFLRFSHLSPVVLDRVIGVFNEGGVSTQEWRASVRESHRARIRILAPQGSTAIRERLNTARQFLMLGTYRTFERLRR